MKKDLRLLSAVCFAVLFLTAAGCDTINGWGISAGGGKAPAGGEAKQGPPDHAPAYGYRAKHQYRYYPDRNVYFDADRSLWFYISGDGWRAAASLPAGSSVSGLSFVEISMDSDKPYTENAAHKKNYPPGQAKKKDKDKGKKK